MIYLLILFTIAQQDVIEKKEIRQFQISIEESRKNIIELLGKDKYEEALAITNDPGMKGRIKILQGKTFEGLLDIEESAMKGDVESCNLFLLSKMGVGNSDIKVYIKMELGIDSTLSLSSPYTEYITCPPESLLENLGEIDSLLAPFIIFRVGQIKLENSTEEAKDYFNRLIDEYPKSIPAIIARNLIRVIQEKENLDTD